jgi:hypothetical protein
VTGDSPLTEILSRNFKEAMEHMTVIHQRRINRRVIVMVCQIREEIGDRAQFLNLVIRDELTNRWISLRLSTFRKVIRWLASKSLDKARRLTNWEKLKMTVKEGKIPEVTVNVKARE